MPLLDGFHFDFEQEVKEIEDQIQKITDLSKGNNSSVKFENEIKKLREQSQKALKHIYANLGAWQITQIARHPKRPIFPDYLDYIFSDFIELHGDRAFGDDQAIKCGFAYLDGQKVVVIGHQKGKNTKENIERNFGMARPEGYRKAIRIMKLAEKFGLPVITFIDTSGAYPGIEAEERGQSEAIARNLYEMAMLEIPIVTLVIGEGGSGGALGISVSDKIIMLSNSIYSVISPEGCASILWRDASKANIAAEALKLRAVDLKELGLVDEIIPEPLGGAHRNFIETADKVKVSLLTNLAQLKKVSFKKIPEKRIEKFLKMGYFEEL